MLSKSSFRSAAWVLVGGASLLGSFGFGVVVGHYEIPPYALLRQAFKGLIVRQKEASYSQIDPFLLRTNPDSLINIRNAEDVQTLREKLRHHIWGGKGFPANALPTRIETNIRHQRVPAHEAKSIDRLQIEMEHGIDSITYLYYPNSPSGKLVIYQQGHASDLVHDVEVVRFFLRRGHHVLTLHMPLQHDNSRPIIFMDRFGWLRLRKHDQFRFLETDELNPIKFFLEPVALSLNYAIQNHKFSTIAIVGISGGGWTASVYAAIDDRVTQSYPVAGTAPMYMRFGIPESNWGDYEQVHPKLHAVTTELEMYVLASHGKNRQQIQVFNKYDPCCFSGISFRTYEGAVEKKVKLLGAGKFGVWLDDTHYEHKISKGILGLIEKEVAGQARN